MNLVLLRRAGLLALLGAFWSQDAAAVLPTVPNAFHTVLRRKQADGTWHDITVPELSSEFSKANCECGTQYRLALSLPMQIPSAQNEKVSVWAGATCGTLNSSLTDPTRVTGCRQLGSDTLLSSFNSEVTISFPALAVTFGSNAKEDVCTTSQTDRNIYIVVDEAGDGIIKYTQTFSPSSTGNVAGATVNMGSFVAAGTPPDPPTDVTADGGDEALIVKWKHAAGNTGLGGFQILCHRKDQPDFHAW